MALTAAEKQRRYRERRKNNPEKVAQTKRKDLERYHANKRLVRDLTTREHRAIKKKWRSANARRKDRARALRIVMHTPESTPPRLNSPVPCQIISRDHRRLSTHGKGAADGIGGFLKRTADQLVARGTDITDAKDFYNTLKNISKVKLHLITSEDITNSSTQIPQNIVPLLGTMKVHQVFTEEAGCLKYRNLSCFCQRGFCSCMDPKDYIPLKTAVELSPTADCNINFLNDISNLSQRPVKGFYNIVYSSDSDDDVPLISLKEKPSAAYSVNQPSTSKEDNNALIEKENIHASKIKQGVYLLPLFQSLK